MVAVNDLLSSAPLGTIRVQVVTMEQTAKALQLLDFLQIFTSMAKRPKARYWSMGEWRALNPNLDSSTKPIQSSFNEIEWTAKFDRTGKIPATLLFESVIGKLVLSPTNELWGATQGYRASERHDGIRLTFDSRHEWVKGMGASSFPTLLDVLICRSASRTASDAAQFFDLMIQGIRLCNLDLIQYACADFNTRSDNVLMKFTNAPKPPTSWGEEVMDAFHPILVLKSQLYEKLRSTLPPEYISKRERLSSQLGALVFAENVLSDSEKRKKVVQAAGNG